jgi:S1-C subfamily serine protease
MPYGIRFIAPADFGFRAEPATGGMRVVEVKDGSPLARYGVRAGDLVTRVGFQATRTPVGLRRALRQGVMEESAVFHVERGGERLTRVVYLDGVPRVR